MAKPRPSGDKRRREREKQRKRQEKVQRRKQRKEDKDAGLTNTPEVVTLDELTGGVLGNGDDDGEDGESGDEDDADRVDADRRIGR